MQIMTFQKAWKWMTSFDILQYIVSFFERVWKLWIHCTCIEKKSSTEFFPLSFTGGKNPQVFNQNTHFWMKHPPKMPNLAITFVLREHLWCLNMLFLLTIGFATKHLWWYLFELSTYKEKLSIIKGMWMINRIVMKGQPV